MHRRYPAIMLAAALAGGCADSRNASEESDRVGRDRPFEGVKTEVKDPDSPSGSTVIPSDGLVKETSCEAAPAQSFLGQRLSAPLAEEARRRAGASRLRVIRPGEAVTEDFSDVRLNIVLDQEGRIIRVHCG